MLRITLTVLLVGAGMILGGCQTMTNDSEEQVRKYSRIAETNRRMLAEDIDAIFLLDRGTSLSPWHLRYE